MINYVNTTINGLTLRGTAYVPDNITAPVPTVLCFMVLGQCEQSIFVHLFKLVDYLPRAVLQRLHLTFRHMVRVMAPLWISRLAMRFLRERSLFPL